MVVDGRLRRRRLAGAESAVDVRETRDETGAYTVGFVEDGEWLEYTVAPDPDVYDLRVRVASARSDRQLRVTLDGEPLGRSTSPTPATGSTGRP